ncbi:hypothetical protein [Streptomyces sp. NPDC058861]|uniref:hypothetical protein n=1 Tax=Streptomyces sp. NPDC058861 TaxID=3346653 RepID=UPI0036AACCED
MDHSTGGRAVVPSQAYAAALREAVSGYLAAGGTQKAIADALPAGPSTLSRYLSAERLLPPEHLPRLRSFLAGRGYPLDDQAYARLESLCKAAYAASGSSSVQLTWAQHELERLTAEHSRSQQIAEARLTELEEKTDLLTRQLEQALDRIEKQNKNLQHAGDYARRVEAELAEQHKQAQRLRQEVEVLRAQNLLLIEEQTGTVPGVTTQVSPVGAGLEAWQDQRHRQTGSSPGLFPASGPGTFGPPSYSPTAHQSDFTEEDLPDPPEPEPEPEPELDPEAGTSPSWLGYSYVALLVYLGWVLWLTFMVALVADPGPSIAVMSVTALIALFGPLLGLKLIAILLWLNHELESKLRLVLLVVQGVTFVGWVFTFMGPVFTVLGVETAATWIADEILL